MRAATKIGLLTGGVVGAAVATGLVFTNQGHNLRRSVAWGADHVKHALHNKIG